MAFFLLVENAEKWNARLVILDKLVIEASFAADISLFAVFVSGQGSVFS